MDYLDPKKQFRHKIILLIGYVLVGVAIVIATLVLLYQAYGFGLNKNGKVIQNGLFFFSSQPHPANIYVDGVLKSKKTNTRLSLPAGIYDVTLRRDGYRDWRRIIALDGGSVEHFDYPFLIPKVLSAKKVSGYAVSPGLATQSPDRRWLVVQRSAAMTGFDVYDLKNPDTPPAKITLPGGLLAKAAGPQAWQIGEWADDNRHVLLKHIYGGGKIEFILMDRSDPARSVNLNAKLSASPSRLSLNDRKYDQYYLYSTVSDRLSSASLKNPSPQPYLDHAINYQSYGNDTTLYVTDSGAPAGKVLLKLRSGDKVSTIRSFPAKSKYLLDLTGYGGNLYVAASAVNESKVYIYKDPVGQLAADPGRAPVPAQVLHVKQPNYLSFSDNAQFIVAEHGTEFGVYDIENKQAYHYASLHKLDPPQVHANWMDGDRLTYVSAGKMVIFDYDNANKQTLISADGHYEPAFTPNYKFVYTISRTAAGGRLELDQTSLLTPADQ